MLNRGEWTDVLIANAALNYVTGAVSETDVGDHSVSLFLHLSPHAILVQFNQQRYFLCFSGQI